MDEKTKAVKKDIVDADGFILVKGRKKKGEIMEEEKQSLKQVEKDIVHADGFMLVEGKGKKRKILEEKQTTESKKTQGVILDITHSGSLSNEVSKTEKEKGNSSEQVMETCLNEGEHQDVRNHGLLVDMLAQTLSTYGSKPMVVSPKGSMKQSQARVLKVEEDVDDSVAIAMIQSNVVVIDSAEAGRVRRSSRTMKKWKKGESEGLLPCILLGILVAIPIFLLVCCICKQNMDLTNPNITTLKLAPPATNKVEVQLAQPFTDKAQVWHIDGPTIEKLLHESASEKPIRYSAQQLRSFTNCYSTKLGHGGFGVVYLGKLLNGMKIAVKVLKQSSSSRVEQQFMAELGTIGTTHHINLVRLYGFCSDEQTTALVYEYMENGSLDKYLFSKTMTIGWEKLFDIAIGSAKGLRYLHQGCHEMIIHYDIKPGNILLDASFSPKVADFGLAKLCDRENTCVNVTGYRGTRRYSAPELRLKNYPVTHKCDVYSFGMLLFEILGRRKNLNVESVDSFPRRVWVEYEKGRLLEMMTEYGIEEKDREMARRTFMVALWCVQDSPEARPPMSSVVKMLEGGVDISPPPEPFLYHYSVVANVQKWKRGDFTSSTDSIGGSDSSTSINKYKM